MDGILRPHDGPGLMRIAVEKKVSVGKVDFFQSHGVFPR
jgi:hypothetical protein